MADGMLESGALTAFFGSAADMISAGLQTDEALRILSDGQEGSLFKDVCDHTLSGLVEGNDLSSSMRSTKAFPDLACDLVETGETSGHLEDVLRSLGAYYDEEDRLFSKLRSSVSYPAALLCVMSVVLAVTVVFVLPVFAHVYQDMAGSLTAGSNAVVEASMVIGWVALVVTLVCTVLTLVATTMARGERGRLRLMGILEHLPFTRQPMYQLALAQFAIALSAHVSSGVSYDEAVRRAERVVDNELLRERVGNAYAQMVDIDDPKGLAQALADNAVFDPFYSRMLAVSSRTGDSDTVLAHFSQVFFEDAVARIDATVDRVEPVLAALLTIATGTALIAVMLPLVGIMRSMG
ncbi:MAG: type II secretion system F family protein [Atopobiaceae bacterium]|jgi:type IV pilus assembly protein PilC|nr:type II secretion system F family protein [Atopobiaceae bacterium]MCI2174082.1 type II secretion system F family protein [Atopobiaceae bacterium]MCI2207828.1 type II secretion system F family protein [Atopobiaceae bacterium]